MYYGITIKEIRLSKKLSQKEVYEGVVSRSFYAKFEKGIYSIDAKKFNDILERLNINFEEFLFFHNKNNIKESNLEVRNIMNIYHGFNSKTIDELKEIYLTYRSSDLINEKLISSTAYALIYSLKPSIDTKPLMYLKEYLYTCDFFLITDLEILISSFFIFWDDDGENIQLLLHKVIKSINILWNTYPDKLENLIGALYVNYIQYLLFNDKKDDAYNLGSFFKETFTVEKISLKTNLYFDFFECLLNKNLHEIDLILKFLKKYDLKTYKILKNILDVIELS